MRGRARLAALPTGVAAPSSTFRMMLAPMPIALVPVDCNEDGDVTEVRRLPVRDSVPQGQLISVGFVAWVTFDGRTPSRLATSV